MSPRSTQELDFTPVVDKVFPSPAQWRDQNIYHLLIDRFDNNQDLPPFDPDSGNRHEWNLEQDGSEFQGGCIKGITRRLDYIRNLGCTAIWISPPFKNRKTAKNTYHGYAIQNFLAVDPRFGTMDDLRELVREAHNRGMYVIIDIVINHTGNNWGYVDDSPMVYNNGEPFEFGFWRAADGNALKCTPEEFGEDDAVWPVELQKPECYKRKGRIGDMASASPDEMMSGDTEDMKDLDLVREDVRDAMIRCHKWWIAQTDCDGFRIDTVKHAEPKAMSIFVNSIREYAMSIGKHNFHMFAEIVGEDDVLMKYLGQNTPNEEDDPNEEYPALCSTLDFPLYFDLENVIKRQSPPSVLKERYERFQHFYRDYGKVGEYFVTFVDNHDQMHRPYYRLMHGETDGQLAVLAIGYLLTSMGIPCIYYGTEQCFNGGGDEDDDYVRETMFGSNWGAFGAREGHFFNEQHSTYKAISEIARIRAAEPALRYGRQFFRQVSGDGQTFGDSKDPGGVFAYARILDVTSILMVINLDPEPRRSFVAVDTKFVSEGSTVKNSLNDREFKVEQAPNGEQLCLNLELGPRELMILKPF
jgi:glycosidase